MNRTQKIVFALAAAVVLLMGGLSYRMITGAGPGSSPALSDAGVLLLPQGRAVPAVSMTDQNGVAVQLDQLKGHWTVLFFGYTFCPDICPTTLAQLRQIRSQLPAASRERLQVILVSIDPHRDTPEKLKQYLGYFDASFQGLVGTPQNLEKLASGLSIPYVPADTSQPDYVVQHSANLALVGPDGSERGFIRAPLNSAKLVAQLPGLLAGE
ncbi:SCO family protein [Pseudomonas sp. dw_358]|uniref:SCO family protein n=1 Tax=Pseudomonas sp. dw_358 TaxID=2720083 RepID=UPI001BD37653|nr:SCO family protein [Pseudomonas sp. dw_358]